MQGPRTKTMTTSLFILLALFQFASGAVCGRPTTPYATNEELLELGEQLYTNDQNRARAGQDFNIDVTGTTLFTYFNEARLFGRPTYGTFTELMEYYEPRIGTPDNCGADCRAAQNAFLDAVLQTQVMRTAWSFLSSRGYVSDTIGGFKNDLKNIWFKSYSRSRGAALDSSGFEHVFGGERRGSSVTGFHSWIMYYLEEKAGRMQYGGMKRTCQPNQVNFPFVWAGARKTVSSLAFGLSPEMELATYTLCFLTRKNGACNVAWGGNRVTIITYVMNGVSPPTVGTAYPRC